MLNNPVFEQKKVVSFFTILTTIGCVLAVIWLLVRLQALIPPFLSGTIIALTLIPEVDRLERRGMSRGLAIGLIYFLFLAICFVAFRGINQLASGHTIDLVHKLIPTGILTGHPKDANEGLELWMTKYHMSPVLRPLILRQAAHLPDLILSLLATVEGWAQDLAWILIVPIITFFLLLDFHRILGKLLILAPLERRESILNAVTEIIAVFGNYVRGVLLVMVMDMCAIYVALQCVRLGDYAVPLAVIAGFLYTIPYFGAVVSTAMIGLVALAVHGPLVALVVTLIMILIHQVVFDNIVAPRVIGNSVNLHPLLTLFALMAGGAMFQLPGTLLAVPVAAAIQVVLVQVFPQLRTDVVTARRAERVVRATLATDTEATKPAARRDEPVAPLQAETDAAVQKAEEQGTL